MGYLKYLPIALVVLIGILFSYPFLSTSNSYPGGDWRLIHQPTTVLMDQSLSEGALPLWTPYLAAGTPFYAVPDKPLSYPPMYLLLLLLSPVAALNWGIVLHVIFAGVFMYLFARAYHLNEWGSAGAGVMFMFPLMFVPPYWALSLTWLPLVFLFAKKAVEKKWVYALASAGALSLMLHAGGTFQFFITALFVSLYVLLIGYWKPNFSLKELSFKPILVVLILGLFFFGFSAVRLLPFMEWREQTSRQDSLPYEVTIKDRITSENAYLHFIDGPRGKATIGFLGLPLLLAGAYLAFKKKNTQMQILVILLLLALILVTGLAHPILYKFVPGFDAQRGLIRNLFIVSFFASLVVGYVLSLIKRAWVAPLLIGILVIDLVVGSAVFPVMVPYTQASQDNHMISYLAEKNAQSEDPFRIHSYEIKGIDYNDIQMLTIPNKIEMMYGHYGGIWVPEYLNEILGVSLASPAKMWGILNVRYVTSSEELNVSGLELVEVFDEDPNAPRDYMDGPFLYQNSFELPRAAQFEHAIVVVGEWDSVKKASYWTLLQDEFNTSTTLLIQVEGELRDALALSPDAIFLTKGSLDSSSIALLNSYSGEVFPNVRAEEYELNEAKFKSFFTTLKTPYTQLEVNKKLNSISISLPDEGYVFLSEKFTLFPGWTLKVDENKQEYYRGDGSVVAFKARGNTAEFSYIPPGFTKGLIITLLSLLLASILFWRYK